MSILRTTPTLDGQLSTLFSHGLAGPHVDEFRERVRMLVRDALLPLFDEAETSRTFPREALARMAGAGLLRERWPGGPRGDEGKATIMAEELGWAGLGGLGIGVMLQFQAVLSILMKFAGTGRARDYAERMLDGEVVGCLAASEFHGGSDLGGVGTTAVREPGGWRVIGSKWFASPGAAADVVVALCRIDGDDGESPLALAVVPSDGFQARPLDTAGVRSLATARLNIDAVIEPDMLIGASGGGLRAITWGLTHERLGVAAYVLGTAQLALELATTHLHRRKTFGRRLLDHQALRLRLAQLWSEVTLARRGVHAVAASFTIPDAASARECAGVKVTASLLAERTIAECMHLFGGAGYVETETPLARLLRDCQVGRLGAGTDEMMWELVAGGLAPRDGLYESLVHVTSS